MYNYILRYKLKINTYQYLATLYEPPSLDLLTVKYLLRIHPLDVEWSLIFKGGSAETLKPPKSTIELKAYMVFL